MKIYNTIIIPKGLGPGTTCDCQEEYNSGYTAGFEAGEDEQKSKLGSIDITVNGEYINEDGYSAITVDVSGYTQADLDNAFQSGWTNGYDSGYTDGYSARTEPYLTFDIISGGTIVWRCWGKDEEAESNAAYIEYSLNGGEWTGIIATDFVQIPGTDEYSGSTSINVVAGDQVRFRGENEYYSYYDSDYINNFQGSTAVFDVKGNIMSLIGVDDFTPDMDLTQNAFGALFRETLVVDASELVLPAKTMTTGIYLNLFKDCTTLTKAPKILPATNLTYMCYTDMFYGCTSLRTVPELPATVLSDSCYAGMFRGCTSLDKSPILPAEKLKFASYIYMFSGCTGLNEITCLATDITATNCTVNWVSGVAVNGTFIKNASMNDWPSGIKGIPSGWEIEDAV